jgi:hypothetical protein
MTQDARQSLIALGSVTLLAGLCMASLRLVKGGDIPEWVQPVGLGLMTINFAWDFGRWLRAKYSAAKSNRS